MPGISGFYFLAHYLHIVYGISMEIWRITMGLLGSGG